MVNYLAPGAVPAHTNRNIVLLYVLAAIVGFIALYAEYLNAAAGSYLPRLPTDGGKWRDSIVTNEARWRQFEGPRDESYKPLARALTAEEQRQMHMDIKRNRANNTLHNWIEAAGLLQYLLLPILLFACVFASAVRPTKEQMKVLAPIGVVIVFALWSLWYRQYFSSLGW